MGITDDLNKQILGWGVLVIGIVIISIVLLKFRDVSGVTAGLNTSINTAVDALDEPVSWISIVVIAVIGFAILKLFQKK